MSQEDKSQSHASQSAPSSRKRAAPAATPQVQASESPPKKPRVPPSQDEGTDAVTQHGKPAATAIKPRPIPKKNESQADAIQQGLAQKKTFATMGKKHVKQKKDMPVQQDPALDAAGKMSEQLFGELGNDSDGNDTGVSSDNDDDSVEVRPKSKHVLSATPGVGTERGSSTMGGRGIKTRSSPPDRCPDVGGKPGGGGGK